jgi:hypothetical protein
MPVNVVNLILLASADRHAQHRHQCIADQTWPFFIESCNTSMMITAIPFVCCGSFAYQAKKAQACAPVPQAQAALKMSEGIKVHE